LTEFTDHLAYIVVLPTVYGILVAVVQCFLVVGHSVVGTYSCFVGTLLIVTALNE